MATFFDKQSGKAERTNEQIEQKKQLLAEKMKEMKAFYDKLVEAGAIELSDEELDTINGGGKIAEWFKKILGIEGECLGGVFMGIPF